tara:strand:- start:1208 stop:2332 length:1125 start_codon:yes stop_codon:yes gene_type:complete
MIIENIFQGSGIPNRRAAMFFKTEPFYTNVDRYTHTNNWEIIQSIRILNSRGYVVDLIDRGVSNWTPKHRYDLFLGLGVGNTGRHFARYSNLSQARKSILLAMGPQPDISNQRTLERYEMFNNRTGLNAPPMRTVSEVTGDKYLDIVSEADYIFSIGGKDTQSYKSFLNSGLPVLNFYPSSSPKISYSSEWLKTRERNSFLCFAGNGFICKGVDLVLEAFLGDDAKELHICGPNSESIFFEYYGEKIKQAPNIFYHGFIEPGGDVFNSLASKCSYVVFHSAAEGCCTSVATAMRAGLVPMINSWTGINVSGIGIELPESGDIIRTIKDETDKASKISDDDYTSMVNSTILKAQDFSQESYTRTYAEALDTVIRS